MTKAYSRAYSRVWRLISVIVLVVLLHLLMRNKWEGRKNIPRSGGVIIVPNHVSYADFGPDALFIHASGRYPVFLIKESAFRVKGLGHFLTRAGQLAVHRGRTDAALVLKDAEKALAAGQAVVIYPESTATRDPELWPMVGKTGAARLALATGAPVIPVAHWGTQDILPYGSKKPRLFPRKTVSVIAGPPVDLSQWAGQRPSARVWRAATAAIMADITTLVATLRKEEAPASAWDPALGSRTDSASPGTSSPGTGSPGTGSPGTGSPGTGSPGTAAVSPDPA